MPWWAGVALAVVAYVVLHSIASRPVLTAVQPGNVGAMAGGMLVHWLALFGQYIIPGLCLIGALMSHLRRRKAQQLHATAGGGGANAIAAMSWSEFEALTAEYFRRRGFTVTAQAQGGPDGGVDVELSKQGDRYLVQCKQWRAVKVGVETVRELYGVMSARRAAGGFVVTSGRFTDAARQFADGREIELLDGAMLERAIRDQLHQQSPPRQTPQPQHSYVSAAPSSTSSPAPPAAHAMTPACPVCNAPMTVRLARKGANAGQEFWGCTRYTEGCRGTRAKA